MLLIRLQQARRSVPISFTTKGYIRLYCGERFVSQHRVAEEAYESALADAEANGGAVYRVEYPNRELDLSSLSKVVLPSAPAISAVQTGQSSVSVTWPAIFNATSYRVRRNGVIVANPTTNSFADTGLAINSSYAYTVASVNANGEGPQSNQASVTIGDATAPSVPANLTATATSSSAISVAWNAATDNVGVTGYQLQRATDAAFTANVVTLDLGTGTSYSATGLSASTQYYFRIRARDAAGNFSSYSATVSATTSAASSGNEILAASASLADVQAAVNAAQDGDTVLIPNGTVTWTGGISTTKQIIIRAQNYTPTPGGTMTRNVTITNQAAGTPLFTLASGNAHHVGIGGTRFNQGTSQGPFIRVTGSGSRVPLLFDCAFQTAGIGGSAEANSRIVWLALGGVCWNLFLDGRDFPENSSNVGNSIAVNSFHVKSPRLWTTASTLGDLDSGGSQNLYIEDSTFVNTGSIDVDDHGRVVTRYCTINGTRFLTHGFTSSWGGRFMEFYNNTFLCNVQPRNMAGTYCWFREGHGLFTDNVVNDRTTNDYASINLMTSIIEGGTNNMTWDGASWPKPRQVGCGHNGSAYVSDPIHVWNNTGARATSVSGTSTTPGVNVGRDIIVGTAKPGYAKYTYPHPFRSAV